MEFGCLSAHRGGMQNSRPALMAEKDKSAAYAAPNGTMSASCGVLLTLFPGGLFLLDSGRMWCHALIFDVAIRLHLVDLVMSVRGFPIDLGW